VKRQGRPSKAQTPAPRSERIKGSSVNKEGSAASKQSAKSIKLSSEVISVLEKKKDDYNEKHSSKVSLATLKAVFRRGAGAYSSSHRPTISGGKPNSRSAWAFARVNKFLKKKSGESVKKAYVQDDDLMAEGGVVKDIPKIRDVAMERFTEAGFEVRNGAISRTDYGESAYFYVQYQGKSLDNFGLGIKVRVSDHSVTSFNRMGSELLIYKEADIDKAILKAELILRKDLFDKKEDVNEEEIERVVISGKPSKNSVPENYYNPETDTIIEDLGLSPKGNQKYLVKRKKTNISTQFTRKQYEKGGKIDDSNMENKINFLDDINSNFDPNNSDMQYAKGGKMEIGRLARGMSLSDIAYKHGLDVKDMSEEYKMGIETEMEHTTDPNVAKAIALDHLFEDPQYYTKLKKVESLDNYLDDILITKDVFADGGEIPTEDLSVVFSFVTPTGQKSRLTYLQQVLVRTKAFKSFFGDWETAAKNFLKDNKENFGQHFKNVSKILYHETLEPRVVFHGTRADQEFYKFNVGQGLESTTRSQSGRPYGYFAHNIEYSMNFTTSSRGKLPFLYSCFLNIRNPFVAVGRDYYAKSRNAKYWLQMISGTLVWDKLGKIERDEETKKIEKVVESQIGDFVRRVIGDQMKPFWYLMSTDMEKIFKHFMISHGYDGIMFAEELTTDYDIQKPDQFTEAEVIFDSNQVKLADGRNLDFNAMIDDIRYKKGGMTDESINSETLQNDEPMTRKERIGMIISPKKYAQGGSVLTEHGKTDDAKKGGYFQGRSHAEGGIKVKNVDTGQYLEVEGEEVIITKGAVNDPKKREFEGQMLTNKEILSKINQSGGGVSFEKGGEIKIDHCGCSGKKYKYGGEILEDFEIIRIMNNTYKPFEQLAENSRKFVDSLINKMKK
jgi:hypothetical protein